MARFSRILALAAALGASSTACIHATGRLDSNRFQHRNYPYAVFYTELGRPDAPIGPDWKVENFRFPDPKHMYAKTGVGYTTLRSYDVNRDGKGEQTREEPFYDLLLAHKQPSGAMWIRSVPLAHPDATLDLSDLAARYLSAAIGQDRVAASFGIELPELPGRSSTGSAVACQVSKQSALRVDFDLPAAARTATSPARPARDGSVVLIKTSYRAENDHPVLLLIGRSSAPEHAAELERDFDRLLSRTVLGELHAGLSMKGGHTCGRAAPPPEGGPATQPAGNQSGDGYDPMLELAPSDGSGNDNLPTEPVPVENPDAAQGSGGEAPAPEAAPASGEG